jgi:hypothetical protein
MDGCFILWLLLHVRAAMIQGCAIKHLGILPLGTVTTLYKTNIMFDSFDLYPSLISLSSFSCFAIHQSIFFFISFNSTDLLYNNMVGPNLRLTPDTLSGNFCLKGRLKIQTCVSAALRMSQVV